MKTIKTWTSTHGHVTADICTISNDIIKIDGEKKYKKEFIKSFGCDASERVESMNESELNEFIGWIIEGDILDGYL